MIVENKLDNAICENFLNFALAADPLTRTSREPGMTQSIHCSSGGPTTLPAARGLQWGLLTNETQNTFQARLSSQQHQPYVCRDLLSSL